MIPTMLEAYRVRPDLVASRGAEALSSMGSVAGSGQPCCSGAGFGVENGTGRGAERSVHGARRLLAPRFASVLLGRSGTSGTRSP